MTAERPPRRQRRLMGAGVDELAASLRRLLAEIESRRCVLGFRDTAAPVPRHRRPGSATRPVRFRHTAGLIPPRSPPNFASGPTNSVTAFREYVPPFRGFCLTRPGISRDRFRGFHALLWRFSRYQSVDSTPIHAESTVLQHLQVKQGKRGNQGEQPTDPTCHSPAARAVYGGAVSA